MSTVGRRGCDPVHNRVLEGRLGRVSVCVGYNHGHYCHHAVARPAAAATPTTFTIATTPPPHRYLAACRLYGELFDRILLRRVSPWAA